MRNDFNPRLQYTLAAVGVIGGVASLGYSVYKGIKSSNDEKSAQGDANNLKRPYDKISDEHFQNQNIAREQAMGGTPIDVKIGMQRDRDRGLSSSLDALKQGGGSPNDFTRLNSIYDDSLKNESADDAKQHFANIQYLIGLNKDMAAEKKTSWGVNEYQPYESKLAEIQGRKVAAKTNFNNAVQEGIGSIDSISTTLQNAVGGYKGGGKPDPVDASHAGDPNWYGGDPLNETAEVSEENIPGNS